MNVLAKLKKITEDWEKIAEHERLKFESHSSTYESCAAEVAELIKEVEANPDTRLVQLKDGVADLYEALFDESVALEGAQKDLKALRGSEDKGFEFLANLMIAWLNKNCNPHTSILIDCQSAEVVAGIRSFVTDEHLRD